MNNLTAPPPPLQGRIGGPAPQSPPSPPTRDEIEEAIAKTHRLNDGLRLLLNKKGGASRSDVIDEAGALISEGVLSSQQAAQELASLPTDNGQIANWLRNHIVNSAVTRGKLCELLASRGAQDRAVQVQPQMQPPLQPMMQNALTAGAPQNG